MPYTIHHLLVNKRDRASIRTSDGLSSAHYSQSGSLSIRWPGKLQVGAFATYLFKHRADDGLGRPFETELKKIPLKVQIKMPDGRPFTSDHVTLDDIRRYRDLRGISQGTWTYKVSGETDPVLEDKNEDGEANTLLLPDAASVRIALEETVPSASAPPLVHTAVANEHRRLPFDLYRVGMFTASASSGAPITAVVTGADRVTLFAADPNGGVFTTSGSARAGWAPWSSVSEGSTISGAQIAAVVTGRDRVTLFLADPGGGVFTTSGSARTGWAPWSSVSEGGSIPGASITAVVTGPNRVTLFVTDPNGRVYTITGSAQAGWGLWSSPSEGSTLPGAPITALVTGPDRVTLFLADPNGGVYTTSGSAQAGWAPWSSVSEGSTLPGAPITALVTGPNRVTLFLADPNGDVYTTSGSAQSGWAPWSKVPDRSTLPGAPIAAALTGSDRVALFLADPNGDVCTTAGSPQAGWGKWSGVSEGRLLGRRRTLRLYDSDGNVVAESGASNLAVPITLQMLDKSRDAEGNPRPWSLEILPSAPPLARGGTAVRASVIETARIRTEVFKTRIDELIGVGGSKLKIYGEMQDQRILARLEILDEVSAATIDMHGLLDSVIQSVAQDPEVDTDIEVGVPYNLANESRDLGYEMRISLNDVKVKSIHIDIGPSELIEPVIPAVKIEVETEGSATVKCGGFPLATCKIRDNRVRLESGLRLNADGSFSIVSGIEESRLDVHVHWSTAVAGALGTAGLVTVTAAAVAEIIEDELNDFVSDAARTVLTSGMSGIPRILAVFLGDDFTYQSVRIEGDAILFDYIAPLELEPKRSPIYRGIIGRSATHLGPDAWDIRPPTLGNTWAAENLISKVDHIVVVMMENRSFDHVLGYIAKTTGRENSDGLTDQLTVFLESQGFPVPRLNASSITLNGVQLKTKFPAPVGHGLNDVTQQLSEQLVLPSGRSINSPRGFLDNFAPRAAHRPELKVEDVLGYYEADDLRFFKFLTDNYAWCEQYYCSHAGPTLPNRMFSLTGDVQYDRTGEAIVDNNNGDNFFLSRAMSIFDLLTRKGIGWRVYESFPSVAMLRMFARYATDNINIVNIDRLKQDIAQGNLPAVTVIEPAMHHAPQNDDHPIADMYRGQLFLNRVYDALRSNDAVWRKTLLIITYDEHGGFYDHVMPPIAEVRTRPLAATAEPEGPAGIGHFTPDTVVTPYGVRVPTFVVSPWVPAGKGPDIVLDHCSILKTIVARFCGTDRPFVSDRVDLSRSFDSYLSESEPRLDVPPFPPMAPLPAGEPLRRISPIVTDPVFRRQMRSGNVDFHDLTGMLARMLGRNPR